ncbi:vacuolar protein sorting-associated protein IST1-like [Impatiens glandulifera]|uniref:vacuolar protein sorting-associated protein IST1-like n=1 Tax=Impatiens glandulifera TaxID=253017 RepID=UPI001FB0A7D8|nr:vacuolar protein sorting-associated protein IST1-like [Impatiens glandulifera]
MGKKFDAIMGKNSKSSNQLKPLLNLALSRLVVLKNQRQARCSLSRSDVIQLLNLTHHDRALLRVEQVIKEENMIDVFVMVEGYCFIILERIHLIEEQSRECPEDVNEAVSSLIYAASRCGEFPELQEIRAIFTNLYGKEFAARAIELRNNCAVNRQMVIKLSPRQPDLKSRLKILNEIAAENNIVLQIQDITPPPPPNIDLDEQVQNTN